MVTLSPMSADDFERWWTRIWIEYRKELISSGVTASEADENIAQNMTATRPDGALAAGNYVFNVLDGDAHVGVVWLADRGGAWFIYDIEIDESQRGKGFGRATMHAIEQYVRNHQGTQVGLSVFGSNKVAQQLYLSEGYEITRLSMLKKLI